MKLEKVQSLFCLLQCLDRTFFSETWSTFDLNGCFLSVMSYYHSKEQMNVRWGGSVRTLLIKQLEVLHVC